MANETDRATLAAMIEEIEDQERRLRLPGFDNDDAWQIGIILVELAASDRAPVTVDLRRNGQQLFHYALPGTSADNDAWIRRKAAVVDRFGLSSLLVGRQALAAGVSFEERFRLDPDQYAAHGGSFPVHVHGVGVVGTITVSGLPEVQDHGMVVAGLEQYLDDLSKH